MRKTLIIDFLIGSMAKDDLFKISAIEGSVSIDKRKTISPFNSAKHFKDANIPAYCDQCIYRSIDAGGNGKCPKFEKGAVCSIRDDYIKVDHSIDLNMYSNELTIDTWIYPTHLSNTVNNTIISKKGCGVEGGWVNAGGWDLMIRTDGIGIAALPVDTVIVFDMQSGDTSGDNVMGWGSTSIELNQWYHVVVSANPVTGQVDIFVNGQQDVTTHLSYGDLPISMYNELPLSIGSIYCDYVTPDTPTSGYFDGRIANAGIYEGIIGTEADAQLLMAGSLPTGFEENVVADWKLNTGSELTAVDHSTNRHHGEILGGTEWVFRIDGCMDPIAQNYNSDATDDDDSCSYEGGTYSLEFDGEDDYVNLGNSQDLNPELFTISTWIKPGDGLSQGSNPAKKQGYGPEHSRIGPPQGTPGSPQKLLGSIYWSIRQ